MEIVDIIVAKFWAAGITLAGVIVWLVRMEAKALANEREIRRLWLQRKEDLQTAKEARDESNSMLHEIRRDVKRLIGRDGSA